jgi:hypothetical protein
MKKIFSILIFSLFLTGSAYAECTQGNCQNGQGTYTSPDGAKYVGEFKDDKINGQGTYTSPDGTKYVGEWKDGKQHGQGTATSADGRKLIGEWKDGKFVK